MTVRTDDPQQDGATWGNGNLTGKSASLETLQGGQDPFYRVKNNHTHTQFLEIPTMQSHREMRADTGFRGVGPWGGGGAGVGGATCSHEVQGQVRSSPRCAWGVRL